MNRSGLFTVIALIVAVVFGFVLYTINTRFVSENPGGKHFLVYWTATRKFLEEGGSPYSRQVKEDILATGKDWANPPQPDELVILFPLYSMVMFLPFAMIEDYASARTAWMTVLEIALIAMSIMSIRVVRWRATPGTLIAYFAVALFGFHSILALIEGNVIILVSLAVVLTIVLLRDHMDEAAAVILAIATVDPLALLLFIIFVLYWGILKRRWRFVVWFFVSIILLSIASMFFLQDWPLQYYDIFTENEQIFRIGPLHSAFASWWPGMGAKLGQIMTAIAGALIILEWWLFRDARDFSWFLWTVGLTLLLSQWIVISSTPDQFVILLLPLALVFSVLEERWREIGRVVILIVTVLMMGIPWGIHRLTAGDLLPQAPISQALLFPFPFLLLLGLYWIRWWTIRPKRTILDELRVRGEI